MPHPSPPGPQDSPTGTRAALLTAGLHLFGKNGFNATSIREIAEMSGANVAAVAYHFGNKEGLRLACGAEIVRRLFSIIGPPDPSSPASPEAARQRLETTVRGLVVFLNGTQQSDEIVAFVLEEIASGGPVLDHVYSTMIEPRHRELCALWAAATGQEPESDTVKLAVFAYVGQILYFRIGRAIVGRRMGWSGNDGSQVTKITDLLISNLHKLLSQENQP